MNDDLKFARLILPDAQRVLVMGCPGAGKSTLARRLADRTGLPLVHLDDLYWQSDWVRPSDAEWQAQQRQAAAEPRWIIDGNYLPTAELRLVRAQAIVVVSAPAALCATRILRRALNIVCGDRAALPAKVRAQAECGEPVSATQDFRQLLLKVARFHARDLPELAAQIEGHAPDAPVTFVTHGGAWGRRSAAQHLPAGLRRAAVWRSARDAFAALNAPLPVSAPAPGHAANEGSYP